jgi:hypothetical protein
LLQPFLDRPDPPSNRCNHPPFGPIPPPNPAPNPKTTKSNPEQTHIGTAINKNTISIQYGRGPSEAMSPLLDGLWLLGVGMPSMVLHSQTRDRRPHSRPYIKEQQRQNRRDEDRREKHEEFQRAVVHIEQPASALQPHRTKPRETCDHERNPYRSSGQSVIAERSPAVFQVPGDGGSDPGDK